MSDLRDALATARGCLIPTPNGDHNAEGRCPSCLADADVILADPAFRLALTESIAEALAGGTDDMVTTRSIYTPDTNVLDLPEEWWATPRELAAAVVARMPGVTP